MSYIPVVARLDDVTPIPGADRIVAATASGFRVVVGNDHKNGELGVVFPSEGVIDLDFALAAGLLREHPITGEKLSGYLDNPARVRCLTLRGVRTEALWIPIDVVRAAVRAVLASRGWTNAHRLDSLADGDILTLVVCTNAEGSPTAFEVARKYVAPPVFVRSGGGKSPGLTERERANRAALNALVPEHYETSRVQVQVHKFPPGALVRATDKYHGESGRCGKKAMPERLGRLKRAANRVASWFGKQAFDPHVVVTGTRRTIVLHERPSAKDPPNMRRNVAEWLAPRLRPGEVIYYELVGFHASGRPIQVQRPRDKGAESRALKKQWGETIVYAYGCDPQGEPIQPGRPYPVNTHAPTRVGEIVTLRKPMHRIIAYRITQDGQELPFELMRQRALEIGVEVPRVRDVWRHAPPADYRPDPYATPDELEIAAQRAACKETIRRAVALAEGPTGILPDPLDPSHPFEGVVLRVDMRDSPGTDHIVAKCKGHGFGLLEGYARDRGERDPEDAGPDDVPDET